MARVIFEKCFERKKCVEYPCPTWNNPGRKCDHCVGVKACISIEEDGNSVYIVISVGRARVRRKLGDTCYPAVVYGPATANICTRQITMDSHGNLKSLKLTVELCVGFSFLGRDFSKCWSVFSKTIHFSRPNFLSESNLSKVENLIVSNICEFDPSDEDPVIAFFESDDDDNGVLDSSNNGEHGMDESGRPGISGVNLTEDCIATLRLIDAKHEAGDAARQLFAWAPLLALASDPHITNLIISVASADWSGIVSGLHGLKRLELRAIARDCNLEQTRHHVRNERKLVEFWKAMYEHYRNAADSLG